MLLSCKRRFQLSAFPGAPKLFEGGRFGLRFLSAKGSATTDQVSGFVLQTSLAPLPFRVFRIFRG
jgi:hypothetical protein